MSSKAIEKKKPPYPNYRYDWIFDLKLLMQQIDPLKVTTSCLTCQNFDEANGEVCKLAVPPSRPPARIIVLGCPAYLDMSDIPY